MTGTSTGIGSISDPEALQRDLLAWFIRGRRDLPWRRRRTLYGTWIAEMMLQQTTVATVVPYWERFLDRFPDVETLAAASADEVLGMWSGLGYYRRARSLHEAARLVVGAGEGRLPDDQAGWSRLPGVGPYASGAIASMGLGERVAAVDANVRRVLTRWAAADAASSAAWRGRTLSALAEDLVPAGDPGAWNEAVMELGALVCTARRPRCGACPVATHCRAGQAGTAAEVPPPATANPATPTVTSTLVVRGPRGVLVLPSGSGCVATLATERVPLRGDLAGLHRGLWGLPTFPWYDPADEAHLMAQAPAIWRRWLKDAGAAGALPVPAGLVRHAITRWRLVVMVATVEVGVREAAALDQSIAGRWSGTADAVPVSRLVTKILACAEANRPDS